MARGINKVILVGNLGNAPEMSATQNGSTVANFNVATDESYKDKNSGQMVPKTEWHRIVVFQKLAEICGQYLKKGSKVYIEGKLQTRKWQDQNGQDRYTTEIVANDMRMLDGKPDDQQQGGYQQSAQQAAPQQAQARTQPSPSANNPRGHAQQQQQNYQQAQGGGGGDFDDDIPFAPLTEFH